MPLLRVVRLRWRNGLERAKVTAALAAGSYTLDYTDGGTQRSLTDVAYFSLLSSARDPRRVTGADPVSGPYGIRFISRWICSSSKGRW